MKRSVSIRRKGPPPAGMSKYAQKQRRKLQEQQALCRPTQTPSTPQHLPAGTRICQGRLSGNFLKDRGYVVLLDEHRKQVTVAQSVLQTFDRNFRVANGSIIECAVQKEASGLRAVKIFSIKPPR